MPDNNLKYETDLDKDLQNLAIQDWPAFVQLVGENCIVSAKICILKRKGKSYNQIANKLRLSKDATIYRSGKCDC